MGLTNIWGWQSEEFYLAGAAEEVTESAAPTHFDLSNQHAHVFALSGCRNHGRKLAAVGNHLPHVHFADDVVDLLTGSDNPNLCLLAKRLSQTFVKLCRHDIYLNFGLLGLKA
jgi:hypothetical protein